MSDALHMERREGGGGGDGGDGILQLPFCL